MNSGLPLIVAGRRKPRNLSAPSARMRIANNKIIAFRWLAIDWTKEIERAVMVLEVAGLVFFVWPVLFMVVVPFLIRVARFFVVVAILLIPHSCDSPILAESRV